jgi:hypothetical protein
LKRKTCTFIVLSTLNSAKKATKLNYFAEGLGGPSWTTIGGEPPEPLEYVPNTRDKGGDGANIGKLQYLDAWALANRSWQRRPSEGASFVSTSNI